MTHVTWPDVAVLVTLMAMIVAIVWIVERSPAEVCRCEEDPTEPDDGPWCEHPYCVDRMHLDGNHTDAEGRIFR